MRLGELDGRDVLRVLLLVFGVAAIAFSARWAYGVVEAFQPDFNDHGAPPAGYRRRIAILGFFGVVASLLAGGSALAYSRTPGRRWITGVVLGGLGAAGLFVVWIDVWEYAGGVG